MDRLFEEAQLKVSQRELHQERLILAKLFFFFFLLIKKNNFVKILQNPPPMGGGFLANFRFSDNPRFIAALIATILRKP